MDEFDRYMIADIVEEAQSLDNPGLIGLMRAIADEIEMRMMQQAGGPIRLTEEETNKLPF